MRNHLEPLVFFILLTCLWEVGVYCFHIPKYLLPAPSLVASTLVAGLPVFLRHAAITITESLAGFLIANILAFVLAVIFAHSKAAERAILPCAIGLKTTPIVALAPLLVLWLGTGIISKIAASALVSFFPMLVNATKGLESIEPEAMELFDSLSASPWQVFVKLRLPSCLPLVFSALKISSSLAVVGAVVGEFVGANAGLGYIILVSSYHLETPAMLAAVFLAGASGTLFFALINMLEKITIYWQSPAE